MRPLATQAFPEAFSTTDLARATRRTVEEIDAWVEAGAIRTLPNGDGRTWMSRTEALRAGRGLLDGTLTPSTEFARAHRPAELFDSSTSVRGAWRGIRGSLAVSSSLHAGLIVALVGMTMLGFGNVEATIEAVEPQPTRLVYLALPGPGGGGGGGGLKHVTKPPKAERKGSKHLDSPIPRRTPAPEPDPPPPPPEPLPELEPLPPVQAPVVEAPENERDRVGVPEPTKDVAESRGPGTDGGVGSGSGTGLGSGDGPGIGEGEGGGTGGGPFRPGSGITPPALLREVKPDYTEEARRLGITGDVVMEIVVRRDGRVGDVRVLQGLGHGLNERAVAAVRQWLFSPATRRGAPVDVLVEVAMEFKLR
jgi:periplasmic protein TonB